MTGVGGTTTQVFIGKTPEQLKPKASFAIENNNDKAGTFDAVITNISAPLGVKEVVSAHHGVLKMVKTALFGTRRLSKMMVAIV